MGGGDGEHDVVLARVGELADRLGESLRPPDDRSEVERVGRRAVIE